MIQLYIPWGNDEKFEIKTQDRTLSKNKFIKKIQNHCVHDFFFFFEVNMKY